MPWASILRFMKAVTFLLRSRLAQRSDGPRISGRPCGRSVVICAARHLSVHGRDRNRVARFRQLPTGERRTGACFEGGQLPASRSRHHLRQKNVKDPIAAAAVVVGPI